MRGSWLPRVARFVVGQKSEDDLSPSEGLHNAGLVVSHVIKGDSYRDKSCIMAIPAISPVPPRVVASWLSLQTPANHKFTRVMMENCEVADAYNQAVALILGDAELSTWSYFLTVETDNIPPPQGLLQLINDIEEYKLDAVGGIYWAKGENGFPMCFGKTDDMPRNFRSFDPPANAVTPVNGLAMGFTLFRKDLFKKMEPPWFRTVQEWIPGVGMEKHLTQDIDFFDRAAKVGGRFAISTRVRVGHLDVGSGVVW